MFSCVTFIFYVVDKPECFFSLGLGILLILSLSIWGLCVKSEISLCCIRNLFDIVLDNSEIYILIGVSHEKLVLCKLKIYTEHNY